MSSKNTPHFYYFLKCCACFFTDDTSLSLNGFTYLKQSDKGECFYTFAKTSFYFSKDKTVSHRLNTMSDLKHKIVRINFNCIPHRWPQNGVPHVKQQTSLF